MRVNEPKSSLSNISNRYKYANLDKYEKNRNFRLDWNNLAVEVRNVEFGYAFARRGKTVLKDVTISIPKSSIYGLLGPSGCGKTTLLRVILGRLNADRGSVSVNGYKPGSRECSVPGIGVGYMPQELALWNIFSVVESITYFAKLYGMTDNHIRQRIKFLIDFLDLPEPHQKIAHLRDVSLAVALVHSPPLLVLDEPTVGADPLLRQRIWKHLKALAESEGTTVLLTTHYIEEAKRADIVSFMRDGCLLIQHSPTALMRHFGVTELETVFTNVCQYVQYSACGLMPENVCGLPKPLDSDINVDKTESVVNKKYFENSGENWLNQRNTNAVKDNSLIKTTESTKMLTLIINNIKKVGKNLPLLSFQLALPTIQIILFCLCIGQPLTRLNVAVANLDLTSDLTNLKFGQLFLNQIDNQTVTLIDYNSSDSAIGAVRDGLCWGALIIKPNFTDALIERAMAEWYAVDDAVIDSSTIDYFGDFSKIDIAHTLAATLLTATHSFTKSVISRLNNSLINARAVDSLVRVSYVYGSPTGNNRDFFVTAFIIVVTFVVSMGMTCITFIAERIDGLIERTLVAGVRVHQLLTASIAVHIVIQLAQTVIMLSVVLLVFGITNNGPIHLVFGLIFLQGLAGISFGILIAMVCDCHESAVMLTVGVIFPLLILSGALWPTEALPSALQQINSCFPFTIAIDSLRNIMVRGWAFDRFGVCVGFATSVTWIAILIFTAFIVAHFVKKW